MSHEMPTLEANPQPTATVWFSAFTAECDSHQQKVEETFGSVSGIARDFATSMREAAMPMDTIFVAPGNRKTTAAWVVIEHTNLSGKPIEHATSTTFNSGPSSRRGHSVSFSETPRKLSLKEIATFAEREPKPWSNSRPMQRISYHANAVGVTLDGELIPLEKQYEGSLNTRDGLTWKNALYTQSNRLIRPADLFSVKDQIFPAAFVTVFTTRLTAKADELAAKKKVQAARAVTVVPTPTPVEDQPAIVHEKPSSTGIVQRDFRLKPAETLFPNLTLDQMMKANLLGRLGLGVGMEATLLAIDIGQHNTLARVGVAVGMLAVATKGYSNDWFNKVRREDLLEQKAKSARELAARNHSRTVVEALDISDLQNTHELAQTELPEALGTEGEKLPTQDVLGHLLLHPEESPGISVTLHSGDGAHTVAQTDTESCAKPAYTVQLNPFEAIKGIVEEAGSEAEIFLSALYSETNEVRDAQLSLKSIEGQIGSVPELPKDAGPKITTARQQLLHELAEAQLVQQMVITRNVLTIYGAWLSHRQRTFEEGMSVAMVGPTKEARLTGGYTQTLQEAALGDLQDFLVQSKGSSSITPKEAMEKATTRLATVLTYEVADA